MSITRSSEASQLAPSPMSSIGATRFMRADPWMAGITRAEGSRPNGKRKKGASERYEALLSSAFSEAFRVLKRGRYMSVVFGNSSGHIWGLVQRAIRDAGFKAAPAHVAILDKGQRSVKGLNSGSESVVTVDLVLTVRKPFLAERADDAHILENGDTQRLIEEVIDELPLDEARNPSHVYARILRKAIREHYTLDQLHLSDVLLALRSAGYTTNEKTGLMSLKNPLQRGGVGLRLTASRRAPYSSVQARLRPWRRCLALKISGSTICVTPSRPGT